MNNVYYKRLSVSNRLNNYITSLIENWVKSKKVLIYGKSRYIDSKYFGYYLNEPISNPTFIHLTYGCGDNEDLRRLWRKYKYIRVNNAKIFTMLIKKCVKPGDLIIMTGLTDYCPLEVKNSLKERQNLEILMLDNHSLRNKKCLDIYNKLRNE